MARPSKFDLGDMPRTRTGLVPTSYRQKVEELSFPWSPLPIKPKPPMYRYRGDYVNERNRKLLIKRKLALNQHHNYFDPSNTCENESLGSILKITPYSTIKKEVKLPSKQSSNLTNITHSWDSYHKHASLHKLSEDEERARAKNKSKFVSYLRVEALKRHERKGKESADKDGRQLHCAEFTVRQRKPPVPRLSHLARSRQNRENNSSCPQQHLSMTKSNSICTTLESQPKPKVNAINAKTNASYLDYISKKSDNTQEQSAELNGFSSSVTRQNGRNDIDDENGTTLRIQIQRIVERAAEMVLNDQNDRQDKHGAININSDHAASELTSHNHHSKLGPSKLHASDDFFDIQKKKLSILEEQILSMESSVISENRFSFIGSNTFDILDRDNLQRENNIPVETAKRDALEINTTGGARFRQTDAQQQQSFLRRSMTDLLNSSDSSSSYDTTFLTNIYHPQSHGRSSRPPVDEKSTTSCSTSTTTCWSGTDNATELMPRVHVQPDDIYYHPYLDPFWEDEPIPRGCEQTSRSEKEIIKPRTGIEECGGREHSESIADDLFSLL